MNKEIKLGIVYNEGEGPDFGTIQQHWLNPNNLYLLARDIPKLNGMLTRATSAAYLPEGQSFNFYTGALAYVVDYKTAGTGKIYMYHRGKDHWYEFNIRSDLGLCELMWNRHETILRETKTISGTPPLTFESNGRPLKNYRIYGNTVNGESVGDLVTEGEHAGEYCVPVKIEGKNMVNTQEMLQGYWAYADGLFTSSSTWICTPKIPCKGGEYYTFQFANTSRWYGFVWYDNNNEFISSNNQQSYLQTEFRSLTSKAPDNAAYMAINIAGFPETNSNISKADLVNFQLERGSSVTEYEPYHNPITVDIYLNHQIHKNEDNSEYIDNRKNVHYHIDGTSETISLPELPTFYGTNILSILTEIQPSNMVVAGKIHT